MKRILSLLFAAVWATTLFAQSSLNINLLGHKSYGSRLLNDCWGYVDGNGGEWALVGVEDGESIVDLSDPANPQEKFFIPGPSSIWRDFKVHQNYAYVTNETSGGIRIINLSYLPDSVVWKDTLIHGIKTSHNVYIENGFVYITGANVDNGGITILDANQDPWHPSYAGSFNLAYVHDVYVRNDTAYASEIYQGGLEILDMTDKANPVSLGFKTWVNAFTHNAWLNDQGNVCFTTDELNAAYLYAWEVSDPQNIQYLGRMRSSLSDGQACPHNALVKNDFSVTSWYNDGIIIVDGSQPENLVEVGWYDTSPLQGPGIGTGCWGVYPFLPSGILLGTDVETGFYVLQPNYQRAAFLEGVVSDGTNSQPILNASISIKGTPASVLSQTPGNYATGTANSGNYEVIYAKNGYYPQALQVNLVSGQVVTQDVNLYPADSHEVTITVLDQNTGNPIPGAQVLLTCAPDKYYFTANQQGKVQAKLPGNLYSVIAGKWGYRTDETTLLLTPSDSTATISLGFGYYDDFAFDFGWKVDTGTATQGIWERGEPKGTTYFGYLVNPDEDVVNDFSDQAYVTGNQGNFGGDDDVSGGVTYLTSPVMNLANVWNPGISFYFWFANVNGANPSDSLIVEVDNGIERIRVWDTCCVWGENWQKVNIRFSDFGITATDSMTVRFSAGDYHGNHFVEAGIDKFQASYYTTVGTNPVIEAPKMASLAAWPVPGNGPVNLAWEIPGFQPGGDLQLQIVDLQGRVVEAHAVGGAKGQLQLELTHSQGLFFGVLLHNGQRTALCRLLRN
ncbi:MAG: choice-of-anchor B family protein [Bacteroidia bacterium]|nr:choice-of-anchor B family protein [Bacteroidia bacterium]